MQRIGKGAYGCVYKHPTKQAAVKVLNIACTKLHEVILEIGTLKHLKASPYIVTLIDVYENYINRCPHVNMILELAKEDLHQAIYSRKKLSGIHCVKIFQQILCGVKHMHDSDIIHRDLKPANILLDQNGNAFITDFGMSIVAEEDEPSSIYYDLRRTGTRGYQPPEALLGIDSLHAGDIWSVGCIGAELFLHSPLFIIGHRLPDIVNMIGSPSKLTIDYFRTMYQDGGYFPRFYKNNKNVFDDLNNNVMSTIQKKYKIPNIEQLRILLKHIFVWHPHDRPTALALLQYDFFRGLKRKPDVFEKQFPKYKIKIKSSVSSMKTQLHEMIHQFSVDRIKDGSKDGNDGNNDDGLDGNNDDDGNDGLDRNNDDDGNDGLDRNNDDDDDDDDDDVDDVGNVANNIDNGTQSTVKFEPSSNKNHDLEKSFISPIVKSPTKPAAAAKPTGVTKSRTNPSRKTPSMHKKISTSIKKVEQVDPSMSNVASPYSNLSKANVSRLKKLLSSILAKRDALSHRIRKDKTNSPQRNKLLQDRIHYNKILKKIRYHINKPRKPPPSLRNLDRSIKTFQRQIVRLINEQTRITNDIRQHKKTTMAGNRIDELNDLQIQRTAVRKELAKKRRKLKNVTSKKQQWFEF